MVVIKAENDIMKVQGNAMKHGNTAKHNLTGSLRAAKAVACFSCMYRFNMGDVKLSALLPDETEILNIHIRPRDACYAG